MTAHSSLRRKVALVLFGAFGLALVTAAVTLGWFEYRSSITFARTSVRPLADTLANVLKSSLEFDSPETANETLAALAGSESIVAVTVFRADDGGSYQPFAAYLRKDTAARFGFHPAGSYREGDRVLLVQPLRSERRHPPLLSLEVDVSQFRQGLVDSLQLLALTLAALVAAILVATRLLEKALTRPVLALSALVERVRTGNDYGLRADVRSTDEIGRLADSFNQLLGGIAERDRRIAEANAFQGAVLTYSGVPIVTTDPAGNVLAFNPAAERFLGYTAAEVIGRLRPDAWHLPAEIELRAQELSAELGRIVRPGFDVFVVGPNAGAAEIREWTFVRKDGTHAAGYLAVSTLRNAGGQVIGFCGIVTDLSARRAAEAALRTSGEQLRQVLEASPVALALINYRENTWQYVNRKFTEWFGYTLADLPDMERWRELAYPDPVYRAEVERERELRTARISGSGEIPPLEVEITTRAGGRRRVDVRAQRFGDGVLLAMTDITERRAVEDAVRASEEQFKLLTEHAPDAIVLFDVDAGHFTAVNHAAERLFGRSRAELLQLSPAAISPACQPDGRPSEQIARERIGAALRGATPVFEWVHERSDGSPITCEIRLLRLPDPKRTLIRGSIVDIGERKRTELALRSLSESTAGTTGQAFFEATVERLAREFGAPFALIGQIDASGPQAMMDTLAVWSNGPAANRRYAIAGTPCEQVVEKEVCHFERDVAALFPADGRLAEWRAEGFFGAVVRRPDGRPRGVVVVVDTKPMVDSAAAKLLLGVSALRTGAELERLDGESAVRRLNAELEQRVQDRTHELEQRIAESERLNHELHTSQRATHDAAGRLQEANANLLAANQELEAFSYSVSHDLRAPLRNITGFIELLRKRTAGKLEPESDRFTGIISAEAQRMGALIDDLLTFSRIGRAEINLQEVSLAELIDEARQELAPETAARTIEWRLGPLPTVRGDRTLLRQVVVNLVANAVKFTRKRAVAVIEIGHQPGAHPGDDGVFFVRDNGAGFNPKYIEKLFRVFQRLHSARDFEGTGIGLANVKRIIVRHGGRIWAEGALDAGATFFFTLRRSPPPTK